MSVVRLFKTLATGIFRGGKSGKYAKTAAKAGEETAAAGGLTTVVDQPGVRILEQVRGDNLFRYETRVINGKPTSTIQVFDGKGEHIGTNNGGLRIERTKTIQVEDGESIFGGKKITIDKNYRTTLGMSGHQDKMVKEYTPEGIYEHGEQYLKYGHWDRPKINKYDRVSYLNGQTPYTEALEAKKAAEAARQAEEKALAEAALKAEQEAAAKIAAETPRVNVGKVFGKNFSELKKVKDKTLADGTVVRTYKTKDKKGNSQYIITKDKGLLHEELIIDTAKDVKIKYTQIGNAEPKITMLKDCSTDKQVKQ